MQPDQYFGTVPDKYFNTVMEVARSQGINVTKYVFYYDENSEYIMCIHK